MGAVHASDNNLQGEIASAETSIILEAGEHEPLLRTLTLRGAAPWENRRAERLPERAEIRGVSQPLNWHLDRAATHFESKDVQIVYMADAPRLKLVWRWRARGEQGPIEHSVSIQNLGGESMWLPLQPSWVFDWQVDPKSALQRFWVEKGADIPSPLGTHLDALNNGDTWQGASSTYAIPKPGQRREMIPFLLVDEPGGDRRGWYVGIEFSGRTRITLQRNADSVGGEAGLDPLPGPYRTRLPPGAVFETPVVFVGAFRGGPDGAGNIVRRWVRAVLNNPHTLADPSYPLLVNNSWGSGMAVDEALAHRMIEDAAQLGLEMFHLDAGWFRDVGDWHANLDKFPHGIARVADFAHAHGLKFGLWLDWTQAGTSNDLGALNVHDDAIRDWLIADPPTGWKHTEPFKGITIDLGVPEADAWAARELDRVVNDYDLDMLEHDGYLVAQGSSRVNHLAAPPDPKRLWIYQDSGFLWVAGSNSTDVSYHATRAYYSIYEQLREDHPDLLLEVCNDGGRMVDFGSAAHGDYFSMTDTYDPLSNRRAFYDASFVLPPAMLEAYVQDYPAPRMENFRYVLRSGMQGWFSLMLDANRWTAEQHAAAQREFAIYKSRLRPLIREADLYHVSPRPDGVHWDGIEYYSPKLKRGVLYAFRGSTRDESTHPFRLLGLDPGRRYRLAFLDQAAANMERSGDSLMKAGIDVKLALPLSSDLVFFEEVP
ncbi:MAG TPA: alpha-galactosidase [Steroidobacteraceae bacterium]|nr:alpha-galactosidase [Steroidobacteraceae bacterium]